MSYVVTKGGYTWTETDANGFDKDDLFNLPKAAASAGAGVGYVGVEESDCHGEAKGPNAEAGAEASLASLSARAKAEVGSASMGTEYDGSVFETKVKGPNAEAGAEASLTSLSASARAKAELASVSATAGNLKGTLGLAADTGVSVSRKGVETKVLGTGVTFGRKVGVSVAGCSIEYDLLGDTLDRPGKASAKGLYARTKNDDSGVSAGAGVGQAEAQWRVFDVGAKGPNAEAGAGLSGAMARAEVGSASAAIGNVKGTVGLAVDTGAKVADGTVEAKVLGTGVKLGRTVGVSLFGTGFEFKLW